MNLTGHQWVLVFGMAIYAAYEVFRKWPADKREGALPYLERNWPRIIFTSVLTPETLTMMSGWLKSIFNCEVKDEYNHRNAR